MCCINFVQNVKSARHICSTAAHNFITLSFSLFSQYVTASRQNGTVLESKACGSPPRADNQGNWHMKLVMAVIKPFKLDEVREALTQLGVQGLTVSEVKGFGRQQGHTEIYRGAEYAVNFLPKLKIEIAGANDLADRVVETITNAARTGQIGDGKIFILDLERAVRIRTGETDADAL